MKKKNQCQQCSRSFKFTFCKSPACTFRESKYYSCSNNFESHLWNWHAIESCIFQTSFMKVVITLVSLSLFNLPLVFCPFFSCWLKSLDLIPFVLSNKLCVLIDTSYSKLDHIFCTLFSASLAQWTHVIHAMGSIVNERITQNNSYMKSEKCLKLLQRKREREREREFNSSRVKKLMKSF